MEAKIQILESNEIRFLTLKQLKNLLSLIKDDTDEVNLSELDKSYLTRKDLCELLHITLPTIYAWTRKGILNPIKIGNRVLYDEDEVRSMLSENRESSA